MTDWLTLTARAAMVSHRLVGWIYWDPVGIEKYGELGPAPQQHPRCGERRAEEAPPEGDGESGRRDGRDDRAGRGDEQDGHAQQGEIADGGPAERGIADRRCHGHPPPSRR